jgi:O-antigen/teichoic acid export membrane protein
LAAGSFVSGFENIAVVDFRKKLEFDREFRFLMIKRLISFSVVVPLAFAMRNYWALVISIVVGKIGAVVVSFWLHPYRPRLSLSARGELFSASKWLFSNNLILLLRERSADLMIGRFMGSHDLGLYAISQEISTLPQQFVAPVNRAVFPGYASQAANPTLFRESFVSVTSLVWALAMPAGIGIAIVAPVLVPVVLGSNWIGAIPIVSILAVSGTLMVIESNVAYVFYALGKPRVTTILMLGYVLLLLPLLFFLTRSMGAAGAAWAHLVTSVLFVPMSFTVVLRYLELPVRYFLKSVWRVIVSVALMAGAVQALLGFMEAQGAAPSLSLAGGVLVGAATYVVTMLVLWNISGRPAGVERIIVVFLREQLERLQAARVPVGPPPD